MAVSVNIGTGRVRHSVRAVVGLAKFGAHGDAPYPIAPIANTDVIRHNSSISDRDFVNSPSPGVNPSCSWLAARQLRG